MFSPDNPDPEATLSPRTAPPDSLLVLACSEGEEYCLRPQKKCEGEGGGFMTVLKRRVKPPDELDKGVENGRGSEEVGVVCGREWLGVQRYLLSGHSSGVYNGANSFTVVDFRYCSTIAPLYKASRGVGTVYNIWKLSRLSDIEPPVEVARLRPERNLLGGQHTITITYREPISRQALKVQSGPFGVGARKYTISQGKRKCKTQPCLVTQTVERGGNHYYLAFRANTDVVSILCAMAIADMCKREDAWNS